MGDNEVSRQIIAVRFETMGASRTYLDFFLGFGWSISIAMVLQTVLLWQLSSLAHTNATAVRPMIVVVRRRHARQPGVHLPGAGAVFGCAGGGDAIRLAPPSPSSGFSQA
jgi:hypothetical protein